MGDPLLLRYLLALLLVGWHLSSCVAQDLFEWAVNATNAHIAVRDTAGVSVRGGLNMSTGTPQATTILRGTANLGGGCGAFDFGASFREQFEDIPEIITNIGESIVAAIPMAALCYATPLGCDLIKHWQQWTNILIQARYASCQSSRTAGMVAGLSLRDGEVARCLKDSQGSGMTLNAAWAQCNKNPDSLRLPGGGLGHEVRLIEDTLTAAGAPEHLRALAPMLMGEVTLRAGDTMGFDSRRPQAALQALYEQYRGTARERFEAAIDEYRETGTVREATLQQASSPGNATARVTIEALASFKTDPVRYETHLSQLTTARAVSQLTWQCAELENALAAGADGNANYSATERLAIEKKLEALRRNLAQFYAKLDVKNKYEAPAVDALMRDFAAVQETAAAAGFRSPAVHVQPGRYRHQTPMGYSK